MKNERVYFVYYKIHRDQRDASIALVQNFQQQLARRVPEISCELMQRPAATPEGIETWMEIYRGDDGLPDSTLEMIAQIAGECGMPAPRLGELFIPLR